jgi:hypothetical protein
LGAAVALQRVVQCCGGHASCIIFAYNLGNLFDRAGLVRSRSVLLFAYNFPHPMSTVHPSPAILKNPESYRASPPLDELLRSIRLSVVIKGTSWLTAPWGIESPAYVGTVVFHFVLKGRCVVRTSPGSGFP